MINETLNNSLFFIPKTIITDFQVVKSYCLYNSYELTVLLTVSLVALCFYLFSLLFKNKTISGIYREGYIIISFMTIFKMYLLYNVDFALYLKIKLFGTWVMIALFMLVIYKYRNDLKELLRKIYK